MTGAISSSTETTHEQTQLMMNLTYDNKKREYEIKKIISKV